MTSIEQLIGDLLLRHNCVIVPSFGGFVAKQVSARVDFDAGKMFAPKKSLLFNRQLINNDGLLINEYSLQNGVSFDEAQEVVSSKVKAWNKTLQSGGRIELDRVGYLFFDAEKNLCFEQDRFFNLLLESFGLGQVHFLTEEDVKIVEQTIIQREEKQPEVVEKQPLKTAPIIELIPEVEHKEQPSELEQKEENKTEDKQIKQPRRKVWRYVAAACILPLAFYSVWIPMKTDVLESGVLSLSDFNPFHERSAGEYEKEELGTPVERGDITSTLEEQVADLHGGVEVYNYEFEGGQTLPVKLDEEPSTSVEVEPNLGSQDVEIQANSMHYIVGCFGNQDNAVNLVAMLKASGMNASIVDFHNGLHRVSAGSAISLESLAEIKVEATGLGYSGWTLK